MENKKILFVHIPIIIILLAVHYFSLDIYAFFYLKSAKKQFDDKPTENYEIYRDGEYTPLLKKSPYNRLPRHPKFVIVEKNQNITREVYFTRNGERIDALYIDNKIIKITGRAIPSLVVFLIPLIGAIIGLYSVVHEILRTGQMISWRLMRNPDALEKTCYLYAVALFGVGLVILIMRNVVTANSL